MHNISLFTTEEISEWLPVAHLAYINGIQSEDIELSAELFIRIKENSKNIKNNLLDYCKDKTVAIICNGPQEQGTGNGVKIDSHDIVVRLNSYKINEEYVNDYGRKVSIEAICTPQSRVSPNVDFCILSMGLYFERMEGKEMRESIKNNPHIKVMAFDMSEFTELQNKYNIHRPSTGLRTIYYFKKILNIDLSHSNIYGNALKSGKVVAAHYYNNETWRFEDTIGDFYLELAALQDIFK
jgi:hypothetical protein